MSPFVRKWTYAISYEIIGLILATALVTLAFDEGVTLGLTLTVVMAMQALLWNVVYNTMFEAWEARQTDRRRTVWRRCLHAILFELGLTALTVPVVMVMLKISFWPALALDVSLTAAYAVYTYVYTLAFDTLFGPPQSAR